MTREEREGDPSVGLCDSFTESKEYIFVVLGKKLSYYIFAYYLPLFWLICLYL